MTRNELEQLISEDYGAPAEYPFERYPDFSVFRHASNRKWFAVLMTIPGQKLGLSGGDIDVVNLKCAPEIISSFRQEAGIFPAYHMSKRHWISVSLDGTVDRDKVIWLLDLSYELTLPKKRKTQKAKGSV